MSEYNIINGQELLHICHEKGLTISEVGMNLEVERGEMTRQQIYEEMRLNLQVMRESIREGLEEQQTSVTGLMGLDADKLNAFTESAIMGRELTRIVASSMAVTEVNASMGRIVAAPTAGASGILPATIICYGDTHDLTEEQMVSGLFNAGVIGLIIARNASLAGASGGCQAETGSAAAMAASALTELRGGTPEMCLHAAAIALKNVMGLVCDPVAGLVECPCIKRNAIGACNAVLCSDMVMAGIESIIPFDEVVTTMKNVGRMLSPDLRETAKGGVAVTPTALKIAERIRMAD
ncbi:MAG: L-serine ammonia-lyase, iron-sulfur-dependent, subunit alpha [Clostridia bacterium]|nr:L-serine ammonia-lyase, iron-sulfur-dependent, subunit alpha [Clostridia bacterium]